MVLSPSSLLSLKSEGCGSLELESIGRVLVLVLVLMIMTMMM